MQFISVEIVTVKGTLPEAGCYWLQLCYVAMTMLDYICMCVQSFMITHTQCYMLTSGKNHFHEMKGDRDK